MKKLTVFLLCTAMLATALTGCGGSGSSSSEPSSSAPSSSAPASSSDSSGESSTEPEHYTYRFFQELTAEVDPNGEMIKYWEDYFNCTFQFDYIEKDKRSEIVPLRLATGDIPDVICTMGYNNFRSWVQEGICGSWDPELFREHAPAVAAAMDDLGETAWKMATIDGKQFTIPGVNGNYAYGCAIIYRDSWLEKAGLSIPRTFDEFEKVMYSFANDDPDGNGVKDTYGLSNTGISFLYGNFGVPEKTWIDDGKGGVIYSALHPQTKAALEVLAKWYADGVIDPEFITGENKGGYWALSHAFDNGRIGFTAMGIMNHWRSKETYENGVALAANQELFYQNFPDETYSFGYPIEVEGGRKYTGLTDYAYWSSFSADFCADTPRLARFFEIIEKTNGFADPQDALIAQYGIEGEQWEYDESKTPVLIGEYAEDRNNLTRIGANGCFIFANNYKTDHVLNPIYATWRDDTLYGDKDRCAMWDKAVPVQPASAADYITEIEKIFDEASIQIITGAQPISYYDTMVENIKAVGYDTLLQEATDIHNEFYK